DHPHADRVAAAVADRRSGVLDRDLHAAAIDEDGVFEHLDDATFAQTALDRVLERLGGALRAQRHHLRGSGGGRPLSVPSRTPPAPGRPAALAVSQPVISSATGFRYSMRPSASAVMTASP